MQSSSSLENCKNVICITSAFTKDLEEGIKGGLTEFVDGMELFRRADIKQSQEHLTQLSGWEKRHQEKFSTSKTKEMKQ